MRVPLFLSDVRHLRILQTIVFGGIILYFGRDVFIPLSFAALISFVLYPVCAWLERKGIGRMTSIIINISILTLLLLAVVVLLGQQFIALLHEWPFLKTKLIESFASLQIYLNETAGISMEQQSRWVADVTNVSGGNLLSVFGSFVSGSVLSAVLMILIPVYAVLILYYREVWIQVLYRIFPSERREKIAEILSLTITTYYNFIKGMALVYLVVGILNSLGLWLLDVPHPMLFGFIAAVLTFIPYVGITIGSLLPATMAWITHDSIWYPLGTIGVFALVQYLEANVIFPIAVSNRLNVNTLMMLLAIFTGGIFWGMSGMILFVPFVGILKLIADHNPALKTLSLALGTGK